MKHFLCGINDQYAKIGFREHSILNKTKKEPPHWKRRFEETGGGPFPCKEVYHKIDSRAFRNNQDFK